MAEQQLPAPTIVNARDGVLDLEAIPENGTSIRIDPYPLHGPERRRHPQLGRATLTHAVADAGEGQPIAFQVPADLIAHNEGAAVQFSYTVEGPAGDALTSAPVELTVAPQE
ncbi:hypothetical protein [Streptomyces sp. NPDC096033]|uniref:hypothetical protein n=1 Tax=Streptomyces sp. NPDC096033 TaxID=3366071 RepID=UPI00380D29E6